MLVSMLSGRQGMAAAFRLGRSLTPRQLTRLGFRPDRALPCHATVTETLRILDPDAMVAVFSTVTASRTGGAAADLDPRQIAIDGKTLRGSKDAEGRAEHVLSAFCVLLEQSLGHASSRGKGLEIPDALRLLDKLNLTGKVVSRDAIFCQKTIASKITDKGGDYLLPVKRNQKDLLEEIETAFLDPAPPPEP